TTLWDDFGNLTLTIAPGGRQTAAAYNHDNEPVLMTVGLDQPPALWQTVASGRDHFGNVTARTDERLHRESVGYGVDNEETADAAGADLPPGQREPTLQLRDAQGNVTLTIDPLGRQTLRVYDNRNRVVEAITGWGSSVPEATLTQYDLDGEVTTTSV